MKKLFITGISSAVLLVSCTATKVEIQPKSGTQTAGTASFTQSGNMVTMQLNVKNLTPGTHAVHIHENGDCSDPEGKSAGGHWNPSHDEHGKWDTSHFHMGDIGNLNANSQGEAKLVFKTDKWCLGCSDASKNIIGKSIIIHAGTDDFHTQPTGNAGGRVGCFVIK